MTQLCIIHFIDRNSNRSDLQISCTETSLFSIVSLLESNNQIPAYKVSVGCYLVNQVMFGWGGFDKWVNEFTEEHWKPISSCKK